MDQEHFPGRSLVLASPRPGSALHRPLPRPLPRASGAARGTAIALAQIDEPLMPIYGARQPLWSRGTSGWSQPPSARGQRGGASPARRRARGRPAPGRLRPPPPGPRPAGFPDVNRAALREHSPSAESVI